MNKHTTSVTAVNFKLTETMVGLSPVLGGPHLTSRRIRSRMMSFSVTTFGTLTSLERSSAAQKTADTRNDDTDDVKNEDTVGVKNHDRF